MGGTQLHMSHIWEKNDLSFYDIKKILSLASQGKLENVTEKLDGFQVSLSFRDGNVVIARNKTDLSTGGMDIDTTSKRDFAGGDNVKDTYINVIKAFENIIKTLPSKTQNTLFKNGKIFYNAEILGQSASNVIKYDINTIKIHNSGHKEYIPEENKIIPFEDKDTLSTLEKVIEKSEADQNGQDFQIRTNSFVALEAMANDKDLKIAKIKLDKIISSCGLSDGSTIKDYLKCKYLEIIKKEFPHISEELIELIVLNLLKEKSLNDIPKDIPKEIKQKIFSLKKEGQNLYKRVIYPIEEVIQEFVIELLRGFKSALVLDNDKEVARIKQEVTMAIRSIQASGNQDAMDILSQQLQKLKSIDNITSASEGIVFEYKGNIFKFTGSFRMVNQILGLFKYGRGSKVSLLVKESDLEDASRKKVIALIPGGFKPPHGGHFEVAKLFSEMPEITEVAILISPKERAGHSADNRVAITAEMSLAVWQIYTKHLQKTKAFISPDYTPIKTVFDIIGKSSPGDIIVLGLGEKEKDAKGDRYNGAQEYADKHSPGVKVKIINAPMQLGGIAGSDMRELIANGQKDKVFNYLPSVLSSSEKEKVWSILSAPEQINESTEKKTSTTYRYILETILKTIEEMSAMSGGAVEGGGKTAAEDPEHSIIREEEIEEDYQADIARHHSEKKFRLIGKGDQSNTEPYTKKPSFKRSKSAPPGG